MDHNTFDLSPEEIQIMTKYNCFHYISYDLDLANPDDVIIFENPTIQPHLNMAIVSFYRPIPSTMIEKYKDILSWKHIMIYQDVPDNLIDWAIEHKKIEPRMLLYHPMVSNKLLLKYCDDMPMDELLKLRPFDECFINTLRSGSYNIMHLDKYQSLPKYLYNSHIQDDNVFSPPQAIYDFNIVDGDYTETDLDNIPSNWEELKDLMRQNMLSQYNGSIPVNSLRVLMNDLLAKNNIPCVNIFKLSEQHTSQPFVNYACQREYMLLRFNPSDIIEKNFKHRYAGKKILTKIKKSRNLRDLDRKIRSSTANMKFYCEICHRRADYRCADKYCNGDFCRDCVYLNRCETNYPHLCNHKIDKMTNITTNHEEEDDNFHLTVDIDLSMFMN